MEFHWQTFCDSYLPFNFCLSWFKLFSAATSIWERAGLQIRGGLLLSAIFHLSHLRLLASHQRGFNVPDYFLSLWNAWIIVGGYGSVIKSHRASIGQRLSQFWSPCLCYRESCEHERVWVIFLLQAWQASHTNFVLCTLYKTVSPPLPPLYLPSASSSVAFWRAHIHSPGWHFREIFLN